MFAIFAEGFRAVFKKSAQVSNRTPFLPEVSKGWKPKILLQLPKSPFDHYKEPHVNLLYLFLLPAASQPGSYPASHFIN